MDDCVSRKKALKTLVKGLSFHSYAGDIASSIMSKVPAEDVKPLVRGHWIEGIDESGDTYYSCSECGFVLYLLRYKPDDEYNEYYYCPRCGVCMNKEMSAYKERI